MRCPKCNSPARTVRTFYTDAGGEIVEVFCGRCGLSLV